MAGVRLVLVFRVGMAILNPSPFLFISRIIEARNSTFFWEWVRIAVAAALSAAPCENHGDGGTEHGAEYNTNRYKIENIDLAWLSSCGFLEWLV